MTTQGNFTLEGLNDYFEQLAQAGEDVDAVAAEVIAEGGVELQTEMQSLVPIDSGNLHDHIQMDGPTREGNFTFVDVGVIHVVSKTDAETARYGNVMEYGSATTAAQPYIRPALKRKKGVVKQAMQKVLTRFGL